MHSEEILHCSGECVQHAGRKHVASAVVGEETLSPALFSTPCWQQVPTGMPAARNVSLCVCTKPVPQLAVAGSCSDARPSTRSRHRCLIIPAVYNMMVTSSLVEDRCMRRATSAGVAGLRFHQWQCQLQLLMNAAFAAALGSL